MYYHDDIENLPNSVVLLSILATVQFPSSLPPDHMISLSLLPEHQASLPNLQCCSRNKLNNGGRMVITELSLSHM